MERFQVEVTEVYMITCEEWFGITIHNVGASYAHAMIMDKEARGDCMNTFPSDK